MAKTLFQTSAERRAGPVLENGDRLTAREFLRRYEMMPDVKKAELVNGVVYMASPVIFNSHAEPHSHIMHWLGSYCMFTPNIRCADNATLILDKQNVPQPDGLLFIEPEHRGRAHVNDDGYLAGSPELVVEVTSSSASIDVGPKLKVYQRKGIREYLIWRVFDEAIDWYSLRGKSYYPLPATSDGILKSKTFPGLWLNVSALLEGDLSAVYEVLQRGVATPAHSAFVKRLASSR
jgi:Uma2 family endonuclease